MLGAHLLLEVPPEKLFPRGVASHLTLDLGHNNPNVSINPR